MGREEIDVMLDDMMDAAIELITNVRAVRTLRDHGDNPGLYAARVRREAEQIAEWAEEVRKDARLTHDMGR